MYFFIIYGMVEICEIYHNSGCTLLRSIEYGNA